ncbi:MAG: aminoglycoside phosphotransferase family protein [Nocardioides sp.]|nr:aminoglycoside phosphotransferase family protein [Nocardioides sp.]
MATDFSSLTPLEGGWSGETFLAEAAGERSVVRIYARPGPRGAAAHEVDAALLRLVRGLLPVPEVLEVRRADEAAGLPALLVTSFLEGERGDLLLPRLDVDGRERLGGHLGALVAALGGMPMLEPGPFVDSRLTIGSFTAHGDDVDGLPALVERAEPALGWWTPEELAGLRGVAVDAQALLDTVTRHCLVHSDLNSKNLLVDPASLEVTGVLDWEFAHAGHPFTDLGNLLRFERDRPFTDAVLAAYVDRRGGGTDDALALARSADLWALVDLATRRSQNPVADRADGLLREIARAGDAQAWPAGP